MKKALVLCATLLALAGVSPAYAGTWLQAYGKQGDCAEGWSASWQEWAVPVTGGAVCTREVDDPSQPVAAPSSWLWEYGHTFTLAAGATDGGPLTGYCQNGTSPRNIRAVPNTDIFVTFDTVTIVGGLQNVGTVTRTFNLELECLS